MPTRPRFLALPTEAVRALREGGRDANGQVAERHLAEGAGNPCRHCLAEIAAGAPMLVLAWRPFPAPQPYAELGPIFLHAEDCPRWEGAAGAVPPMLLGRDRLLIRGYGANHRIVYGTGQVVATRDLAAAAEDLLGRGEVAYLHARSAANNCYQCRIERG
jgi:hypothetical protein